MLVTASADQRADLKYLNPFLLRGTSSKRKLILVPTVQKKNQQKTNQPTKKNNKKAQHKAKAKDKRTDFICCKVTKLGPQE